MSNNFVITLNGEIFPNCKNHKSIKSFIENKILKLLIIP